MSTRCSMTSAYTALLSNPSRSPLLMMMTFYSSTFLAEADHADSSANFWISQLLIPGAILHQVESANSRNSSWCNIAPGKTYYSSVDRISVESIVSTSYSLLCLTLLHKTCNFYSWRPLLILPRFYLLCFINTMATLCSINVLSTSHHGSPPTMSHRRLPRTPRTSSAPLIR
jgi:hypothetical protein